MKNNNVISIATTAAAHGYRIAAIQFNISRGAVWGAVKKHRDAYASAGGETRTSWGKRRKSRAKKAGKLGLKCNESSIEDAN